MMRALLLASFSTVLLACSGSEPSSTPEEGTDATSDVAAAADTGSAQDGAPADSSPTEVSAGDATPTDATPTDTNVVDAPDYSGVNPIQGVGTVDVKKVAGGFGFTEGTLWDAKNAWLLFSDIPNDKIHKLTAPNVTAEFRMSSGKSNGLAWDPQGRLLAAEHWNRRVSRTMTDGSIVSIADTYMGKKLNSPNDVIVRSDGTVYFTDPSYGLEGRTQELTFKGVFRIAPAGTLHLVDDTFNQPNGVALSPDEKTLYVADSASPVTRKWTVAADGTVSGKSTFVASGSDGMAIDDAGNVYLTNGGMVKVYKPTGEAWGTIAIPEGPTNCSFGGPDRKTLYVSAQKSIYSVALKIPGKP